MSTKTKSMADRAYGRPHYSVEIMTHGAWVPYANDRKRRDETSARRLMARLQESMPDLPMRVVPRSPAT